MNLQRSVFMWPDINCKLTEVQGSFKDKITFSYGLYLGHEHDVGTTGKLRLGIDGSLGYAKGSWAVDFKNDTNASVTSVNNIMASLYANEGVYLSYLLTPKLSLNGGIDFFEAFILPNFMEISTVDKNGNTVESPLFTQVFNEDETGFKDVFKTGFKVSARLRAGVTYNFNSLLFVSGNIFYSVPVYFSFTKENLTIEGDLYGVGKMGIVSKYRDYIQNLGISFTFGFKL